MKFTPYILIAMLGMAVQAVVPYPPAKVTYDGIKVMRIELGESRNDARELETLIHRLKLSMWTHVVTPNTHVDVEVPADKWFAFLEGTKKFNMSTMHEDLGISIRAEAEVPEGKVSTAMGDINFFNNYHAYNEHLELLNQLVTQSPDRAEIINAGKSYQGRFITGIHIYGPGGKGNKPAVIFHGTVHAREWITTMVTQYIAFKLLSNSTANLNPEDNISVSSYLDHYDFYIFPVVNPDGFTYSQTTARLWRKNRQPTGTTSCIGHDINRNWDSHWDTPGGASTDPCDETFKGSSPGDTPEFKSLSSFNNNLSNSPTGAKLFIDWHSYSQLFMTPYGYSCSALPADHEELVSLAQGAVDSLESVHGTKFTAGPICKTIYQATGSSVDYAYDVSKIKYSFTAELRDTGKYGFVVPPELILPTAEESWAAVRYLLGNIK